MHNHAPADYECPFCYLVSGGATPLDGQQDVVLRTPTTTAFIAGSWWPNNRGHVIVIPNDHHENLYDLPRHLGHDLHDTVQQIATAIRATYGCEGTSTRQHNEPAGDQEVWHVHTHVFPRYPGDDLHTLPRLPGIAPPEQRLPYAAKLRAHLS
ncbi:HIT family protein [Actinokineospora bangkokensis]|uniref:Diadenosine tetraphosphate hydrolase n=1 Tax=Actinokineospora bangkokensis TaxID=1193682 RepID=A0A1Q9LGJ2_9PSEU|nr:HIT family protein [Actinokineospora bangkokensis]OLR91125.1 diadenosine tetraphosphate hydrolase [Actinokineospora bangkokensis]